MSGKLLRRILWGGVLTGLGMLLLAGCGTARERYRTLSFFFDGVPDPDAVKPLSNEGVPVLLNTRVVKQHPPYRDNKCDACHRGGADLNEGKA